ncbi:MAG: replication factor C large subunit, partial [Halobacteriaceae archaeon]
RDLTVDMAAAYDLDEEELAFVTGSGKSTNKVQSIVEEATELRQRQTVEHSGGAFAGEPVPADADENENDDNAEGDGGDDGDGQSDLNDFF